MSSFSERVYFIAANIPKGKVATYGQIARAAGNPRAARAVGMLMSKNKETKRVPCHRVVAADGSLTGYAFGGIAAKKKKLLSEGVLFRGDRVDLDHSGAKNLSAKSSANVGTFNVPTCNKTP